MWTQVVWFRRTLHCSSAKWWPREAQKSDEVYQEKVTEESVVRTSECGSLLLPLFSSFQFSSVAQSCPTLCDPMNHSMPGFPIHHQLPESTQTHVHWVGDDIQPSHRLLSPSPLALSLSQHQGLFEWVSSFPASFLNFLSWNTWFLIFTLVFKIYPIFPFRSWSAVLHIQWQL